MTAQIPQPAPTGTATDAIDGESFRSIMGAFPSGVTVVTTLDATGAPQGVTVSAFISVSADPPMLAVCLAKSSRTLAAMKQTGAFAAHVLAEESAEIARHFASPGHEFGHRWSPSEQAAGVPVLMTGAVAVAECAVQGVVPAGDHELIIGLILGGRHNSDSPMVYHRRQFGGWASARGQMPSLLDLTVDPLGA